jgi:hypothetical protein
MAVAGKGVDDRGAYAVRWLDIECWHFLRQEKERCFFARGGIHESKWERVAHNVVVIVYKNLCEKGRMNHSVWV